VCLVCSTTFKNRVKRREISWVDNSLMSRPGEPSNIARVGALVGNPVRALIINALMDGRKRSAGELALLAGATPQAISTHLASLVNGGLLVVHPRGRHRYYLLRDEKIAEAVETLLLAADAISEIAAGQTAAKTARIDPALKRARRCYDHLAGNLGVAICDALIAQKRIVPGSHGFSISAVGEQWLAHVGLQPPEQSRRCLVRPCLDWTERRPHVAGWLGAALCEYFERKSAFRCVRGTRALQVTHNGRVLLREQFGVNWSE
jgi:DNA-binding transcriptional ArsR family regulator